jgi:hypothetical protein
MHVRKHDGRRNWESAPLQLHTATRARAPLHTLPHADTPTRPYARPQVHVAHMRNQAPILSEADLEAIRLWGAANRIDYVCLSFTRHEQVRGAAGPRDQGTSCVVLFGAIP